MKDKWVGSFWDIVHVLLHANSTYVKTILHTSGHLLTGGCDACIPRHSTPDCSFWSVQALDSRGNSSSGQVSACHPGDLCSVGAQPQLLTSVWGMNQQMELSLSESSKKKKLCSFVQSRKFTILPSSRIMFIVFLIYKGRLIKGCCWYNGLHGKYIKEVRNTSCWYLLWILPAYDISKC